MIKYILIFLAIVFLALPAQAHPHVWVDTKIELLSEKGKIIGFRVLWGFDEFYSNIFLSEADKNGNKQLDADEVKSSVNAVFEQEQKALYPFFYMKPNGKKASFTLKNAEVYMKKETLYYKFDVIFDKAHPLKGEHHFGIFDPEFYVSFEQDLKIKLPEGISCTQKIAENEKISIYYDLVNPETYTMNCS